MVEGPLMYDIFKKEKLESTIKYTLYLTAPRPP